MVSCLVCLVSLFMVSCFFCVVSVLLPIVCCSFGVVLWAVDSGSFFVVRCLSFVICCLIVGCRLLVVVCCVLFVVR